MSLIAVVLPDEGKGARLQATHSLAPFQRRRRCCKKGNISVGVSTVSIKGVCARFAAGPGSFRVDAGGGR